MRFLYLNTANIYPQDKHLISGLKELGHEVTEVCESMGKGKLGSVVKRLEKESTSDTPIIVGFTSPLFVIAAWRAHRRKIIFNAVLSQYEANIISRREYGVFYLRAIKWWVLDFLSFHLSWKVLLESDAQIEFVHRFFFVPRKKLVRSYSGVDEGDFFFDPSIQKLKNFTVLFRGRFLPESGILTVLEAAKLLENENVRFRVIGAGFLYKEVGSLMEKLSPKNVEMIPSNLSIQELREKMLECHISLGQLADHPRLSRTLPCKLFESLALKMPYLTGRNKAVFELLTENTNCITSSPGDAKDLAKK